MDEDVTLGRKGSAFYRNEILTPGENFSQSNNSAIFGRTPILLYISHHGRVFTVVGFLIGKYYVFRKRLEIIFVSL